MVTTQIHHDWNVNPMQAIQIQRTLSKKVITRDDLGKIQFIAGIDVGFEENGKIAKAAITVLHFPELILVKQAIARRKTSFPYIPGLLSFREVPAILDGLEKIQHPIHLLICDGQGIAHPRYFGIACHLGVLTGLPSIGVGKSRLIGVHKTVHNERGAWTPLEYQQRSLGAVLRTRVNVKPVYVSIGHKISLETALQWTMACTTRYKLPEPIRLADKLASCR